MEILVVVFLIVLVAELGDKTQLLVMALASRFKMKDVIFGVGIALFALNMMAVGLGNYLSTKLPMDLISVVAAYIFVLFGAWTLKSDDDEEENAKISKFPPLIAIALGFFIAELGDKTQLTALALSAKYGQPVLVFMGAFLGMVIADGLGIIAAIYIGRKIPQKKIAFISAWIFILFGVAGIYNSYNNHLLSPIVMAVSIIVIILLSGYFMFRKIRKKITII